MIVSRFDPTLDLTFHEVSGPVTAEELGRRAVEFVRDRPTPLALWDFTGADVSGLSAKDLRTLLRRIQPHAENRRGGRTALVFGSTLGFGLGRMAEAFGETSGFPYEFRAFRELGAALLWLKALKRSNGGSREETGTV